VTAACGFLVEGDLFDDFFSYSFDLYTERERESEQTSTCGEIESAQSPGEYASSVIAHDLRVFVFKMALPSVYIIQGSRPLFHEYSWYRISQVPTLWELAWEPTGHLERYF
jgi:hypothetical protein